MYDLFEKEFTNGVDGLVYIPINIENHNYEEVSISLNIYDNTLSGVRSYLVGTITITFTTFKKKFTEIEEKINGNKD